MKYLGMDVHAKATTWCLLDASGEEVQSRDSSQRKGYRTSRPWLRSAARTPELTRRGDLGRPVHEVGLRVVEIDGPR